MGEAMAEGKQPNERGGGSDRHFHVEGQQKAQHRDGSGYAIFDEARRLGVETERRANNHQPTNTAGMTKRARPENCPAQ